jgi:hypothetical protein
MGYEGGGIADIFRDGETNASLCARELADDVGAFITDTARELAPMSTAAISRRPPGTLKRSYAQIDVHRGEPGPAGEPSYVSGVESYDYIARIIEIGAEPHEITGRRERYVRFRASSGEMVRARIKHPGFTGRYVVRRAVTAALIGFPEIARPALDRWQHRQIEAAKR